MLGLFEFWNRESAHEGEHGEYKDRAGVRERA